MIDRKIICIVPRLPPAIDGVGDYALCIAQKLRIETGITTFFIVCDPYSPIIENIDDFQVLRIEQRSESSFLETLKIAKINSTSIVLVHLSGYGYDSKGCPVWLLKGLQSLKMQNIQIVTMFHELYIKPKIDYKFSLISHFCQKNLVKNLLDLSNINLTNIEIHARHLKCLIPERKEEISNLPVISNVGEPQIIIPLTKRKRTLVIFGQVGNRERAYKYSFKSIQKMCEQLNINEIIDIGPPLNLKKERLGKIAITKLGCLSTFSISQVLSESFAGFINYGDSRYLAKSGVFAAYCAHGLLPIVSSKPSEAMDGLQNFKHYLVSTHASLYRYPINELQNIATSAHIWYKNHSTDKQVQHLHALLRGRL